MNNHNDNTNATEQKFQSEHLNQLDDAITRIRTFAGLLSALPADAVLPDETISNAAYEIFRDAIEVERLKDLLLANWRSARGLPAV